MEAMGKYIYGIIAGGDAEAVPLDGVAPFAIDAGDASDMAEDAADGGQAYTVVYRDIAAVVTDAPIVDYKTLPKESLACLLVRHQQVIEKVMARHAILPLRLGTCAASDDQVQWILTRGYRAIKEVLRRAEGMVEMDVTATIHDFSAFLRSMSQSGEIRQAMQSLSQSQQGITTEDQVKIGLLVKQRADGEKQQMSSQIQAAFAGLAGDVKTHDLMDDAMVLNSAFLIRSDRQQEFDDRVEQLNARFENVLDFRRVGPLPPYSFHTLEVRIAHFEEVDWARRQLGLPEDYITTDAIKKAHRRVALTCHPDKNPNVPDIEKKFYDMSRAYKLLLDCCRASGRAEREEGFHVRELNSEKYAILVTTQGQYA